MEKLNLFDLVNTVLQSGKKVRFKARGHSMSPFVRDGDMITLKVYSSAFDVVNPGDIVAVSTRHQKMIVHRVLRVYRHRVLLKGDNYKEVDGFFTKKNIMGFVTKIERNGRPLTYNRMINRFIAWLSGTGLLADYILPILRYMKSKGMFPGHV